MKNITGHKELLAELGLPPGETNVYLAMISGYTRVKEIIAHTDMKRPSVYYAIAQLEKRGLVGRVRQGEYNQWRISSYDRLRDMVVEKKRQVDLLESQLDSFVQSAEKGRAPSEKVQVTYYEGAESIKRIVFDSLYCKSKHIRSLAPIGNFFFQVGEEFATRYVTERKDRGITTENLWEELLHPEILQKSYDGYSEIRIVPKDMRGKFKTTMFLYDDKVMYVSSAESNYAVIFQSEEHSLLMNTIFEGIWSISKHAFPPSRK